METRHKRLWTREEMDLLESRWGTHSIARLSTMLKRTKGAILKKARKMNLGGCYGGDDRLTFCKLIKVITPNTGYRSTIAKLLKKGGLPTKSIQLRKRVVRVVNLDDFWKWAEKNKELINWSNVTENVLGKEPSWVKERRRIDFLNHKLNRRNLRKRWTTQEDEQLRYLITTGKPVGVIADKLDRTETGIRRRCWDLYLPLPPKEAVKPWSEQDVQKAVLMKAEGYHISVIAKAIGRSENSVYGKLNDRRRAGK